VTETIRTTLGEEQAPPEITVIFTQISKPDYYEDGEHF
jgi:hypothetical protein